VIAATVLKFPAQTPLARRYIAERGRLVENAGTFDLVAPQRESCVLRE